MRKNKEIQTDQYTIKTAVDHSSIANCQTEITGLFREIFRILFKN